VVEAMLPYLNQKFGNASAVYQEGREARAGIDNARDTIGRLIGTEGVDILFLSGGTEADNLAIKGVALANKDRGNHIITSVIEHHAVLHTCQYLKENGFQVTYVPVDRYGIIDIDCLKRAIRDTTILISIMHSNNEVGTIEPVEEVGEIARSRNIYCHTDAVQSFGKIPLDVEKLKVDLMTISAHKFYGPKATGALYVRKNVKLVPLIHGGAQERSLRSGTENVAGIVGMAKAAQLSSEYGIKRAACILELKNRLYDGLMKRVDGIHLNGHPGRSLVTTLNVSFDGVEAETLVINLDLKGISVSAGAACASGSVDPSHVLLAMGVPVPVAKRAVRFSLGYENTVEEIDYCAEMVSSIVKKLRSM
jgi:cysteine desulfurase